jgi:ABC-type antimicrobial peptide transport system permease subunit
LIYLFLNYNLSFDTFHEHSDRIYRFTTEQVTDEKEFDRSVPPGFANAFKEEYDYAEHTAKMVEFDGLLIDFEKGQTPQKLKQGVTFVEADFFRIFNFPLVNGTHKVELAAPNTAVLTEALALKMFGKTNVVGSIFVLENDKTIQITGVLKDLPRTSFLNTELFISFANVEDIFEFAAGENWGGISSNLQAFTLLKPNQDVSQIETVLLELPKKHRPDSKNRHTYRLQPLADMHLNPNYDGIDPTLLWIFGIIGLFLIIIASINFINISTAQAFYRSKEIGIRKVLGGQKNQLFWQFLSETFIISLFAMVLGFVLAVLFLPSFNALFELQLEIRDTLQIQFFLFLGIVLLLVAFLSGSYPGILMSRIIPVLALKGKLNHRAAGGTATRKVLVVAQFAISILLISATIIISQQIDYAVNSDIGFDKESIVMTEIPSDIEEDRFYALKDRLKNIAGVKNVSGCLSSPGGAESFWSTGVQYSTRPEVEEFSISAQLGDEDYLETFGIELIAGRNFVKRDTLDEMVVNAKLAQKLGLDSPEEMLGKQLAVNGGMQKATIVGVVKDLHNYSFTEDISPIFIAPRTRNYSEIAIKIDRRNTKNVLASIAENWSETFKGFVFDYRFLDERVAEQYETEQRYLSMSKIFAGLAILIGCLGLYGLVLFFVGQRLKEIGIRKVLGGSMGSILKLFSVDFIKLILVAGVIATPISWYVMKKWLDGYAYKIDIQWWYFLVAIGAIMIITMFTIAYQTIKAALANPIKSLRTE